MPKYGGENMENCIFCKIAKEEIPSSKVYEDDKIFAFKDINPGAPVHILIIPKEHIQSVNELEQKHKELVGHIFVTAGNIAKDQGCAEDGYRIVTNCGEDGGQSVPHLHFHLLGGRHLAWPPG
jgi:histidine triad (HIT) family protein